MKLRSLITTNNTDKLYIHFDKESYVYVSIGYWNSIKAAKFVLYDGHDMFLDRIMNVYSVEIKVL